MKDLDKDIKKMDVLDIGLIKIVMVAITLFVITIWQTAMDWVHGVNTWYFLGVAIILAIRPLYRYWIK